MDRQGQVGGSEGFDAVAAIVPTTVGILVVAGMPSSEAASHVEREMRAAVRGGMLGGSDLAVDLALIALERAPEPMVPDAGAARDGTPVEAAVRLLPWPERLATLAHPLLGSTRLGPGRPEVVAQALGARTASWDRPADPSLPLVDDLLAAAVERRQPPHDPDLASRLARSASAGPVRSLVLVAVAVVVVVVVALVALLAWSPWSGADSSPANDGFRIRQWVAVLDTGPDAASLAEEAWALGPVLGVHVFTDRWACYEGVPGGRVGEDDWFLGIASVDRATVDQLVAASGRTPLLEAEVFQICVLPPPSDFPAQP